MVQIHSTQNHMYYVMRKHCTGTSALSHCPMSVMYACGPTYFSYKTSSSITNSNVFFCRCWEVAKETVVCAEIIHGLLVCLAGKITLHERHSHTYNTYNTTLRVPYLHSEQKSLTSPSQTRSNQYGRRLHNVFYSYTKVVQSITTEIVR